MNRPGSEQHESPPSVACNIDARGRLVRLVAGVIVTVVGLALLCALLLGLLTAIGWWVLGIAALLSGLFQIYEGRAGWCALRAMDIRTPV